jgi:hypothetical protein
MADLTDAPLTVLDHIDNIVVPGDVFAEPVNEYWALVWLREGMEYLYHQVRRCDEVARQQVNPGGNVRFMGSGNFPAFQHLPQALLTCSFHWYAISACQYVRTVGAISWRHDNTRQKPLDYAKAVIPEVVAFRDKVAAHFAWCTANQKDNPAERFASIIPPLVFQDDSFHVGALAVHLRQDGKASNSTAIQPWSLSRIHERLRQRYWPALGSGNETGGE